MGCFCYIPQRATDFGYLTQWAKSGGQALIEEDSSVLVTLGVQDIGILLLK